MTWNNLEMISGTQVTFSDDILVVVGVVFA